MTAARRPTVAPVSTLVTTAVTLATLQESLQASAGEPLNLDPPFSGDAQEIRSQLGGVVKVVPAEAGDALGVGNILESGLQSPVEGHKSDERKRREENQREHVEGGADVGGRGHQSECNQAARHRHQENARAS